MHHLRIIGLVFAAFFILNVQAQPYPNKPVRIVVPFAPGGATDVIARIISVRLTDRLKQRVIVDNRPGGAAILGSDLVAKSPADGYTLLFTANPHTVNLGLQPKLPYHPMDDFEPITLAGLQPLFLTLHPSISAQTLPELITELKAHPDKYSYSTSGTGGPQHLAGEMFKSLTGTRIMHIPFKGAAPATTELLSGRVQIGFAGSTNVLQFIPSGKLKILATSSATRTRFAPQIPTLQELGLTGFESVAWLGLLAPKGVPADIIQLLADEVKAILNEEKTKETLNLQGIEGVGNTPKEFTTFLRADLHRTNKIIKENNITPD